MDFITLFNQLFEAFANVLDTFSDRISLLVFGMALVVSMFKSLSTLWSKGYDHFIPAVRAHAGTLAIILCLCLPVPFLSGGSFITSFPVMIVKGGMGTAAAIVPSLPLPGAKSGNLTDLPMGLRDYIKEKRGIDEESILAQMDEFHTKIKAGEGENKESSWGISGPLKKAVLQTLICAGIVLAFAIPCGIGSPFVVGPLGLIAWSISGVIADAVLAGVGEPNKIAIDVVQDFLRWFFGSIALGITDMIVYTMMTFGFYGLMIVTMVKAVIYCVTFPISLSNMAFDGRRQVFISAVIRIFALGITPVVAAVVFAVCIEGYCLLTVSGGIVDKMITTYAVNDPAGGALSSVPAAVSAIFEIFLKWIIVVFAVPGLFSIGLMRLFFKVPSMIQELLGEAVVSSGLTEKMGRFGGAGKLV